MNSHTILHVYENVEWVENALDHYDRIGRVVNRKPIKGVGTWMFNTEDGIKVVFTKYQNMGIIAEPINDIIPEQSVSDKMTDDEVIELRNKFVDLRVMRYRLLTGEKQINCKYGRLI